MPLLYNARIEGVSDWSENCYIMSVHSLDKVCIFAVSIKRTLSRGNIYYELIAINLQMQITN